MLLVPQLAQAQDELKAFGEAAGLPTQSLPVLVARIIRAVLGVIGFITVGVVIYGGYLYLLSQGDPAKIDKAKTILKNGAIGLVIIFSSYSIAWYILNRLLEGRVTGGVTVSEAEQYYEPLSGALGRGVINDHYPPRNATDVARNTNIMISFNEPISPASMMSDYVEGAATGSLNAENIVIYPVSETGTCSLDAELGCTDNADCAAEGAGTCTITSGEENALLGENVVVSVNDDFTIYTFNPVKLLGNSLSDTNYIVNLSTDILTLEGADAFSGAYAGGYEWTFEVSTEVDLTPPTIVSVAPVPSATAYARNTTVQINFSEAMDPVAAAGVYQPPEETFTHIEVADTTATDNVTGTYSISNNYKTVEFTTFDACGRDPCGDTIYCLPGNATLDVQAHAAPVISGEEPQAQNVGGLYDGLVDAAGNSLDGDDDWAEGGEAGDDYQYTSPTPGSSPTPGWTFKTSAAVDYTPPEIASISPDLREGGVALNAPVTFTFAAPLKSSTVTGRNVILLPDPDHELWYSLSYDTSTNTVTMDHGSFLPMIATRQYYYWPILTHGLKSASQICMFPANGPSDAYAPEDCDGTNSDSPLCCTGEAKTVTEAAADSECTLKSTPDGEPEVPVYTFTD